MGGSITAPNPEGVKRCIQGAVADAGISPDQIDAINGHLTATYADPVEVKRCRVAWGRDRRIFPGSTPTKSMIGHCLGAAGAIECVAVVLQLALGLSTRPLNSRGSPPQIVPFAKSVPHVAVACPDLKIVAKAGFGFGDVNSCLMFKKWEG